MMKKPLLILGLVITFAIVGYSARNWDDTKRTIPDIISLLPVSVGQPLLVRMMNAKDEIIAQEATYLIGKIGGQQSYAALLRAIENPIPMVRHNAINAFIFMNQADMALGPTLKCLANLREEPYVIDSAIALLKQQRNPENRAQALTGLKTLRDTTSYTNMKSEIDEAIAGLKP